MNDPFLTSLIREIPDFPKPGILFRDISPLFASPKALTQISRDLVSPFDLAQFDLFAGIESRGFILASLLAGAYAKGFVPLRKAGKLPPPLVSASYKLEYGEATLEMNPGRGRVLIVDDVLATGGTLQAAVELCARAGYVVQGCSVLINLTSLNDFKYNSKPVHSVLRF